MIEKALRFLIGLHDVEVFDINDHTWTDRQLVKVHEDQPAIFQTKTLASLVELIQKESSHEKLNNLIVHVESPTKVNVVTTLRGDFERYGLYSAVAELPQIPLGSFVDMEKMNILLKSAFVQSDSRDELIALLGNIMEENVNNTLDDGISQTVVARKGIATKANVTVKPIQKLIPYRTFLEVEQPESEFLLRLHDGPQAALFEADGGAWKLQARKNIAQYFHDALGELIGVGKVIVTE